MAENKITETQQTTNTLSARSVRFSLSPILFWLKGQVDVDYRFVNTEVPNTILSIIPAGKDKQSIPLKNISSASINTSYKFGQFVLGVFIAIIGLSLLTNGGGSVVLGVIIAGLGVLYGLDGIKTTLRIQRAGEDYLLSAPFWEKNKIINIKDAIDEALAIDTDKTDLNMFFEKK